ncbi:putative xyloglucan:xyloglucosyl transferase [Helianthus annuus]|nr:putative xyloglucan:xyloglucosyl transferase [Helianthus annuus]
MALFLPILLFMCTTTTNAQGNPPSPGYNPSSKIETVAFDQAYESLWGPQNQRFDEGLVTIWLDKSSG